ncbi:MAG: hypothetical protein AB8B69_02415 [Chitinophagales bacterium]
MFNESNISFLERYFAKQLTKKEKVEFEKLKSDDSGFEELVGYFEDFMVGMEDFGDKAVMLELKSLEKVIQQEELEAANATENPNSIQNLWKGLLNKADYTLDQLAALFRPVPNYQSLLSTTHRGNNIPINKTNEEWDLAVADKTLVFSSPTSLDLSLVVENNQRKTVWTSIVPKNSTEFTLSLKDTSINAPGRYYIKLSDGQETVILEFLVRKDWM